LRDEKPASKQQREEREEGEKGSRVAGTGPIVPGAKPPNAEMPTMIVSHAAAAAKAASLVTARTGDKPISTHTMAA